MTNQQPQWFKSSWSNGDGSCIEVANLNDCHLVRDTKDRGRGPILHFTADEWRAFVLGVKGGEFDSR